MSYPRACTAARRLSKGAASSASRTVASAVARFTRHSRTPGCLSSVFSTRCTQEPQVMPVTSSCSSFSRVVPATPLPHEAGHGRDELLDLAVALALLEALPDTVAYVVIEEAHADRLRAAVTELSWVRMSMQYLSSSTIRCRPRTCPSIRRRRSCNSFFLMV